MRKQTWKWKCDSSEKEWGIVRELNSLQAFSGLDRLETCTVSLIHRLASWDERMCFLQFTFCITNGTHLRMFCGLKTTRLLRCWQLPNRIVLLVSRDSYSDVLLLSHSIGSFDMCLLYRWRGSGLTPRLSCPSITTSSLKIPEYRCHTTTTAPGICTLRMCRSPTEAGTCVKSTRTPCGAGRDIYK